MISSFAFTATSHPIQLPQLAEGLGTGILISVWVLRTGTGVRQRILDLATADGTHLFVGTGDQSDSLTVGIEHSTTRKEVVAVGALPQNRWVKVTAKVSSEFGGMGTLELFDIQTIQGYLGMPLAGPFTNCSVAGGGAGQPFVGALSGLEINRLVVSGSSPVPQPVLWARYPLDGVKYSKTVTTAGIAVDYYAVDDTSPNNHDGLVAGALQTLEFASRGSGAVPVLLIPNDFSSVRLSPVQGLGGTLTLETWLNPASMTAQQTALSLGDDGDVNLAMTVGGNAAMGGGNLNLMLCRGTQLLSLVEAHSAENAGVFQHLAVTLSQGGMTSNKRVPITVSLYLNGQLSTATTVMTSSTTSGSGSTTDGQEYLPLYWLLNSAVIPEVLLSGQVGSIARFKGQLSEVRIWNTCRSAQEIASRFLSRLIGSEAGLLACYRLEQRIADCVYDISAGHGIGKAPQDGSTIYAADGTVIPQDFTIGTATNLPLQHTSNPEDAHLNVKGKLVTEYLVYNTPTNATEVSGPVTVFDATLEPVLADGSSQAGGTIQVCPDWDTYVYLDQPTHICMLTLWTAKTTYDVEVPVSGKLRLRFKASDVWFRTLRARFSDMPEGVWTLVRPDSEMQANMASVTGASLLSPPQGKASPLPAGTTAESADVCASALATIADCYRPSPNASTSGLTRSVLKNLTKSGKKAADWTQNAASTVGSTLQKAGTSAGQFANALVDDGTTALSQAASTTKSATALVCHSATDLTDLIHATSNAIPRVGTAKIIEAIVSADRLAFVSTAPLGEIAHRISIIGTSIVNGVTYAWRAEAAGWANAVRAMSEFLKKIGASIQHMIEFLAWLFNWNDFLLASDGIYNDIVGALDQVPAQLKGLSQYKDQIKAALTPPASVPTQSLSSLCGVKLPDMEAKELDYVLELGQKLMSAADFQLDGLSNFTNGALAMVPAIDTARLQSVTAALGAVSSAVVRSATGLLNTPVNQLVGGLFSASTALIDFVFDAITTIGDALVQAVAALLTGRIRVPHLSAWIESTILGGRQLNLLRIISLAAGIVQVLATKIMASADAGQAKPQPVSFAEASPSLLWSNFAMGVLATLVEIPLVLIEEKEAKNPVPKNTADPNAGWKFFLEAATGVLTIVRSILGKYSKPGLDPAVAALKDTQVIAESLAGGSLIVWSGFKFVFSDGKNDSWLYAARLGEVFCQSFYTGLTITTSVAFSTQKGAIENEWERLGFIFEMLGLTCLESSLWMRSFAQLDPQKVGPAGPGIALGLQAGMNVCELAAALFDAKADGLIP